MKDNKIIPIDIDENNDWDTHVVWGVVTGLIKIF